MKSVEQLIAAFRDLRFAIDRLSDGDMAAARPTTRHALEAQAKALQADIERLVEEMRATPLAEAAEKKLMNWH